MKMLIGFFSGMVVCGLLLIGVQSAIPIRAESDNTSTDNFSLVHLLPDIERIYREALLSPLHEAEKTIYDDDIAQFYRTLLEKSALDYPEDGTN